MRVDAAGRVEAHHHGQKGGIIGNQAARHTTGAQDFLAVIDIVQEGIDGAHALFDALGKLAPFVAGQHPWHDIEGDQALVRRLFAIDVESNADLAEEILRLLRLAEHAVLRL